MSSRPSSDIAEPYSSRGVSRLTQQTGKLRSNWVLAIALEFLPKMCCFGVELLLFWFVEMHQKWEYLFEHRFMQNEERVRSCVERIPYFPFEYWIETMINQLHHRPWKFVEVEDRWIGIQAHCMKLVAVPDSGDCQKIEVIFTYALQQGDDARRSYFISVVDECTGLHACLHSICWACILLLSTR